MHPRYHNRMFSIVDPIVALKEGNHSVMKNCGYEDTVMHHLNFMQELKVKEI